MTIKKLLLLLLIVPLVFAMQSCGKGAGEGYTPPGSGPGSPVYIKLKPSRYAAQTNGCIEFYAEVHDAQGELLANIPVQFTNLSEPFGQLLDRCGGTEIAPPVRINTDSWGRARVTLYSTTSGFATVLASTDTGEQPRDRKTVLFSFCSTYDCLVLAPSLQLDVDSEPPDGIWNEAQDFMIFNPPPDPDNMANLWATVRDQYGVLIPYNAHVVWGSDHAEASFTRTESYTNEDGVATAQVEFTPSSLRGTETHVNVWAYSDNVSSFYAPFDIVTFFLQPVFISNIAVTADPSIVAPDEDSTVTATLTLNTGLGDPVPDGVMVIFSTCTLATCANPVPTPCGIIDPFSQTIDGQATATFTAPPLPDTCRVNARVNSTTGSVDILVTTELTVTPDSRNINGTVGGTATFTITGGVAPYTVISDSTNPDLLPDPETVNNSGETFEVVVPAGTADETVTYTIRDAVGTEVTATLTIAVEPLAVIPTNNDINGTVGGTATFTINGGLPGYTITSDSADPNLQPAPPTVGAIGGTFAVTVPAGTAPTTVTYTIRDTEGTEVTATVTVSVNPLTIAPSSATVDGTGPYDVITFTITDGVPPYTVQSDDLLSACNDLNNNHNCGGADTNVWDGTLMNGDTIDVTVPAGTAATTVTLTVTDSVASTTTATVNIL